MNKRTKTAVKVLFFSFVGLVVAAYVAFLWFSRDPTTQLVDASGQHLTAGVAEGVAEQAAASSPFDEVRAMIEREDFTTAKAALLQIIKNTDRDGEACMLLCDVSRELNDLTAAVDYGLKATKLLPDSAEAHLSYAKALGAQMFYDMQGISGMLSAMTRVGHFRETLHRVIQLDPDDTEARTMLVFMNMAPRPIGNIDKAVELSREIESRDPPAGMQLRAACYNRQGETDRAVKLLHEGIEQYPEENSFHTALADIYAEGKRFAEADAEYQAARQGEKNEAYYRSLYGQARMRIRNEYEPERAIELLDTFIAGNPEGDSVQSAAHALWRKGNALEQLNRTDEARKAYEESARRDPSFTPAAKALEQLQK